MGYRCSLLRALSEVEGFSLEKIEETFNSLE
jgi:hypothetical protein